MPIRSFAPLAAMALAAASPPAGVAQDANSAPPLDAKRLDPALLLPPPPTAPDALRRDLEDVRAAVAAATPAERARAAYDDAHEDPGLFDATLAPGFALERLPATWALLKRVQAEGETVASRAKVAFPRIRPWGEDPRLIPCEAVGSRKPTRSYPSGHAMLGWSVGLVLANLLPDRAQAVLSRSREYAYERLVCAEHHPSDVEASHALAASMVAQLEAEPAFRAALAPARAELQAALAR